jgi:hypothetical protein
MSNDEESLKNSRTERAPQVTAQVWMRGSSGRSGATISDPVDGEEERAVAQALREHGFEISESVNGQFAITAPLDRFESYFSQKLEVSERQGLVIGVRTADGGLELDTSALPGDLVDSVFVITFSEPPDFGPVDY